MGGLSSLFGNKSNVDHEDNSQSVNLQDVVAALEERVSTLEKRVGELERALVTSASQGEPNATLVKKEDMNEERLSLVCAPDQVGLVQEDDPSTMVFSSSQGDDPNTHRSRQSIYLAAPHPDGSFAKYSPEEQVGKSIYQLTTEDGINGCFIMLDSREAIGTAMISVSQFIKPVCKVMGPSNSNPRHILTLEEGMATKVGNVWKVTRKAVVRFE